MPGRYVAHPAVVRARTRVLGTASFPELAPSPRSQVASDMLPIHHDALVASLATHGYALATLDRPLTGSEVKQFGERFGALVPERDAAVQTFVTDNVLLILNAEYHGTRDVSLEPFSDGGLRLHTESSTRPAQEQPWLVILSCVSHGLPGRGLQTLVVRSQAILDRLGPKDADVLTRIRVDVPGSPPMLRSEPQGLVLAVRDFGEPMYWTGDVSDPAVVQHALDRLWLAAYDPDLLCGVSWLSPTLLVIDNTRVLHGRNGASAGMRNGRRLQRVRVVRCPGEEPACGRSGGFPPPPLMGR